MSPKALIYDLALKFPTVIYLEKPINAKTSPDFCMRAKTISKCRPGFESPGDSRTGSEVACISEVGKSRTSKYCHPDAGSAIKL
jgi:hypothetical protein